MKLYLVTVWEEGSGRIRRFLFKRPAIVLGSDKKADLRLKRLRGLEARLDFQSASFVEISKSARLPAPAGGIVGYSPYAFLWKEIDWKKILGALAIAGVGLSLLVPTIFARPEMLPPCLPPRPELETSFRSALKRSDLIRARSELQTLQKSLEQIPSRSACSKERASRDWETDFDRSKWMTELARGDFLASAKSLKILKTKNPQGGSLLERRFLSGLRSQYLEAYRLEDDDPAKAMRMMEDIRSACSILEKAPDCFREN